MGHRKTVVERLKVAMGFSARVLADSVPVIQWPNRQALGSRLTTLEVTFPRIVLAEFNTHRVFSRNSASSRAIPVKTMLEKVRNDPFVPVYWGKNQKGMQAEEELSPAEQVMAREKWLRGRDVAIDTVQSLLDLDVHKQIANRILEPWLWHTVIVTATEWDNFWGLRRHRAAQPEMHRAADVMYEAFCASVPRELTDDQWHVPLCDDYWQLRTAGFSLDDVLKISVGRCARVSYLTHDGTRDPKADIVLCERLQKSGHMSPFEHVARPMTVNECEHQYGTKGTFIGNDIDPAKNFCGNLRSWVQYRKTLQHESNFLARPAE
jgi:thymidylate synthase ThyX